MTAGMYWHSEAVVRARQAELAHRAHESRHRPGGADPDGGVTPPRRRRPAPARAVGTLLIGLGRWLAGAEAIPGRGRLAGNC